MEHLLGGARVIFEYPLGGRRRPILNAYNHDLKFDGGSRIIVVPKSGVNFPARIHEGVYTTVDGITLTFRKFLPDPAVEEQIEKYFKDIPGLVILSPQIVGSTYGERIWVAREAVQSELTTKKDVRLMDIHQFNVYPKELMSQLPILARSIS